MDNEVIKKTFEEMKKALPQADKCPDDAAISRFLEGVMDERETEEMEEHLASCAMCCDYVVSFNKVINFPAEETLPQVPDEQTRKIAALVKERDTGTYSEGITDNLAQLAKAIREFFSFDWMTQPVPVAVRSVAVALLVVLIVAASLLYYQKGRIIRDESGRIVPLGLDMEVIGKSYITTRGTPSEKTIKEGDTLLSNDFCRISFELTWDAYAYVLYYDSTGKMRLLYPDAGTHRRIKGEKRYFIPEEENDWFQLDNNTGTETVIVLGSDEPIRGLNETLDSIRGLNKEEVLEILATKADVVKDISFKHM